MFGNSIFCLVILGLLALIFGLMYRSWKKEKTIRDDLNQHGVRTKASITSHERVLYSRNDGNRYRCYVTYNYEVGGMPYSNREQIRADIFDTLVDGSTTEVSYSSVNPKAVRLLASTLEPIMFSDEPGSEGEINIQNEIRVRNDLSQSGVKTKATIISHERVAHRVNLTSQQLHYYVTYSYEVDGRPYSNRERIQSDIYDTLIDGSMTEVIYASETSEEVRLVASTLAPIVMNTRSRASLFGNASNDTDTRPTVAYDSDRD